MDEDTRDSVTPERLPVPRDPIAERQRRWVFIVVITMALFFLMFCIVAWFLAGDAVESGDVPPQTPTAVPALAGQEMA
jgi:hypothetical protein